MARAVFLRNKSGAENWGGCLCDRGATHTLSGRNQADHRFVLPGGRPTRAPWVGGCWAPPRELGACLSPWLRFPSFPVIQPRSVCAGQVSDGVHTVLVTESSFPFEPGALLVWWSSSQPTWKWNPSESRPHPKARASRPGGPGVRAPACARVVQSWVMLRSLSAPCSPGRVGVSGWQETAWCSLSRLDAAG